MKYENLIELIGVIKKLRDPDEGCPWDIKQTHKSLLKFLIEEAHEFVFAVNNEGHLEMEEELGDILLQVLLHAQIGSECDNFDIESISKKLSEKMKRRHPHVFGELENDITEEEVKQNWAKIKQKEKGTETKITSDVLNFPALFSANKIGEKTNRFGFDWPSYKEVEQVVIDEWKELQEELDSSSMDESKVEEEYGDLLFSVAQLGRHLGINPELSLQAANAKFLRRFHKMEELIKNDNQSIDDMNQDQMDIYWKRVKNQETEEKNE